MEHSLFETIAAIARPENLPLPKPEAFRNYQEAVPFLLSIGFTIETKNSMSNVWKKDYEDSTMHNMTEHDVIEYANRLRGIEPIIDVMPNKMIPIDDLELLITQNTDSSMDYINYKAITEQLQDLINKHK